MKGDSAWQKVSDATVQMLPFIEKNFGKYPYPQYSFIHGGDGGMEYPMATLLSGPSLGTVFHEWMHNWYQMMLGTNESLYGWMDEGFTSYAEDVVMKSYEKASSLQGYRDRLAASPDNKNLKEGIDNILPEDHAGAYEGYFALVRSGLEEPLTTHADHFNTNFAYSIASYSKGEIFMEQLGYIVGAPVRDKILLAYYDQWKYKHPDVDDFLRIAENVSGMHLDWYKEYWVNSTKTIDYGIDSLWEEGGVSKIRLSRVGKMPMPVDLQFSFADGSTEIHNIPLSLMYGTKQKENARSFIVHEPWKWTHPSYTVTLKRKLKDLKKVEIDSSKRMADVERKNNLLELKW
jgi:aminopeptidase N